MWLELTFYCPGFREKNGSTEVCHMTCCFVCCDNPFTNACIKFGVSFTDLESMRALDFSSLTTCVMPSWFADFNFIIKPTFPALFNFVLAVSPTAFCHVFFCYWTKLLTFMSVLWLWILESSLVLSWLCLSFIAGRLPLKFDSILLIKILGVTSTFMGWILLGRLFLGESRSSYVDFFCCC